MKTTIDLPDDLVRKLKLRAVHDQRKFKDIAAEFLRKGLVAPSAPEASSPPDVRKDKKTGLPVIQCRVIPPRNQQLTPDEIAHILTQQESAWAGRARDSA